MNHYGFPPNYQPDEPKPPISDSRMRQAKSVNAQFIRPDGEQVCKRLFEKWLIANRDGSTFGAWQETKDFPDGWIKIENSM